MALTATPPNPPVNYSDAAPRHLGSSLLPLQKVVGGQGGVVQSDKGTDRT